jgi:hypothetical protein
MTVAIRCNTYSELISALDARRRQLRMTMLDLDNASGVQDGYSAKLICGKRKLGHVSLPLVIEALAVELYVALPPAAPVDPTGSAGRVRHLEHQQNLEPSP